MGQSSQALGDRPETVEPHAVALAVTVRVFAELRIAGPVPGVLDRPAIPDVPQQCRGCGPETRVAPIGAWHV